MPTFTVLRDGSVIEDAVFDVDPVVDTANPFGDFCVVKMDDRGGKKFENYARGTRIEVEISPDDELLTVDGGETITTDAGTTDTCGSVHNSGTYANQGTVEATASGVDKFTGYAVERRETEQSGADVLEVEAYSFDQFLRRNTVTNDQRGNTITEALQDIIQTDTPVAYNAANVSVGDGQELTRTYQGEAVENVLRDLAFKSNNEDFGVNDSLEFFFRQRETVHIDRGIDNTQWFNYDIPELGKEAINEVEVWFDDGEESVIVDDGTDKLDLQDSLGLPSPGTQRAELNRPLITDIGDAEDIGRKYLAFKNATLSGTVTTYGLFTAEPGDTIDIQIDPRGIDAEFVIAGMEYRWGRDETILTIVEKRGDVDDILTELNDSVQRQEMESANRDAPKNRITTTNATAIVSVTADGNIANTNVVTVNSGETLTINSGETETATTVENAGTVSNQGTFEASDGPAQSTTADRFVNSGRSAVRDAWTGDSPPDITTLVVGSDGSGLSRSNTSLSTQTNSATVSQTLPDAKSVEFAATITQTGVQEIGLAAADGTLITRATFDSAVDLDGEVTITLAVSNDDSVSRGVLTDDGQTAVRDVLADSSPALPDQYAYGSSDTPVAETGSSLGNELVTVSLDEILIQSADTQTEWEQLAGSIGPNIPAAVASVELQHNQVCFFREGENADRSSAGFNDGSSDTGISGDNYLSMSFGPDVFNDRGQDFGEWDFTTDYTIPAAEFAVYVRHASNSNGAPALRWILEHANGTNYTLDVNEGFGTTLTDDFGWVELPLFAGSAPETVDADLDAGTEHTLRVEITDSDGLADEYQYWVDCVAPIDGRYVSDVTFGETTDGNDTLPGPEKFPSSTEVALSTVSTRRDVTQSNFDLSANDVSNEFYVELANDGSTFTRVNNSETGSVTFSGPDRGVDTNIGLSRFTADATTTPRNGDRGQSVDVWELSANPDAVLSDDLGKTVAQAVVPPNTSGIVGETVREAGLKSSGVLLTRHILADFDLLSGQRLSSSESSLFTGDN